MFKLKPYFKPSHPEEGFSMLEVLVTALVTVGFLLGALQATTLATLLRVQAQRKTEAINLINQEKALIEYAALNIPAPVNGTRNANCNLVTFRDTLSTNFPGNIANAALDPAASYTASVTTGITLLNRSTYRMTRFYRFSPDPTNGSSATTIQVTWHLWDEGITINDSSNPNLNGSGGDSDDRSIAIITTAVAPNPASCP